ncbi:MAG: hypothetical protein GX149_02050 [Acholeplasmataceae bacterium]|nr:hypothetical protein [Acholeplasmataceae bacterium]
MFRKANREPNFNNFIKTLKSEPTARPVLFEFIISEDKERYLIGEKFNNETEFDRVKSTILAFDSAGYDFSPIIVRGLTFEREHEEIAHVKTKSINEGNMIKDWASFYDYSWPEISDCDFSIIKEAGKYLHPKAKFIPFSLDGILENTIGIVGYETLCLMIYDDYQLAKAIFNEIGKRIKAYFVECLKYDEVGAILCNDDWGFNTQTMLSPKVLRECVFPWYKEIVEEAHKLGKYAILHSCGYYNDIIDDIINKMKFDGKHSYEDNIIPVEKAYANLQGKIAVIGGIDINFLTNATPEEVYKRSKKMLLNSKDKGGYALGSGNSIPEYIPLENYLALLKAANEDYDE